VVSIFNSTHARRIEKLAQAVDRQRSYDQTIVTHGCGAPACLMGWAQVVFKNYRAYDGSFNLRRFLFGDLPPDGSAAQEVWGRDYFSPSGCNDAGTSGSKAAKFLRQAVKDMKAALKVSK
jgi:hypothetical protein